MKSSILKSYRLLVSRSLDKTPGWRQIKLWFSLHAIIFWKENQLVQTEKNSLTHGLENQSVSWGSSLFTSSKKLALFHCFFLLLLLKFCENGRCIYEIEDIVESTPAPQFDCLCLTLNPKVNKKKKKKTMK